MSGFDEVFADDEPTAIGGGDPQRMRLENALADAEGKLRVAQVKHEVIAGDQDVDPGELMEAEERVAKAERDVALAREVVRSAAGEQSVAEAEEPPAPEFNSVYEFVEDHLSILYERKWRHAGNQRVWCPQWWAHPEAVSRLESVWRAFESLRLDPTLGMSVWWRDHVDPHMTVLSDPDGPFTGCSAECHDPASEPIPIELMPDSAVRSVMSAQNE
ncbi:DUF4913 domain-containing protein [Gordonia sp. (in: high G+C Gram-positive bacteria)]|uniref:DUF4913 domain-containing protein n=1 Tax=Gordonia sp. (in: high G+C Gram-positive bacteria) TaxID=84139 RepID=UPI003C7408CA